MELRHIRYFLAVADELNFTRAAEKLNIAQPPLSRQIQDLEQELGVRLFLRKPHMLQLSEEGLVFKQYALQILNLVDRSKEDIQEMEKGLQGTLYLACVEGHAPRLFAQWIAGFQKKYPHVQYNLWNGNSDDVIHRVMKGLCELAIIVEPHNAEGVDAITVYQEPWVAMIPGDHPLAREGAQPIEASRLLPYELIIPSRESRLAEISAWFGDADCEPIVRCRIAHMLNAYELTRQGVGIAIYPASAASIASEFPVRDAAVQNGSELYSRSRNRFAPEGLDQEAAETNGSEQDSRTRNRLAPESLDLEAAETKDSEAVSASVCIREIVNPSVKATYVLIWDRNHRLSRVAQEFLHFVMEQIGEPLERH